MTSFNIVFLVAGVLAILYGLLVLWSAADRAGGAHSDDWIKSDEVTHSKYHRLGYLKHMLDPARKNISTGRSKGRGYAMVAIGIVLIVFGIT
ncbi:MAG: hypothetical protein KGL00_05540 [Gammaproteobacteria bacterium]|nr:hypothetical protein [Gammaproteobacteria bacterium]MDE2273642.1 hypothetical protein [Gammaproteobacteria bacterium]